MERENEKAGVLIDLGAASSQTLGADGAFIDFVRLMNHWGISID